MKMSEDVGGSRDKRKKRVVEGQMVVNMKQTIVKPARVMCPYMSASVLTLGGRNIVWPLWTQMQYANIG